MILISKFKKGFIEIINNFEKNLINLQSIDNIVFELIKNNDSARKTLEIFDKNKHEMKNTKNSYDKYYHAKANCEAAELGMMQAFLLVFIVF